VVVGSGASLASLRAPRLITLGDHLTVDIGRRNASEDERRLMITLPDRTVSGMHARIQRALDRPDLFVIHDLGSTNGTFVDGRRLEGLTPLRNGAIIFVGSQVLVFRTMTAAELAAIEEDAAQPLAPVPTMSPALALTTAKLRRLARSPAEMLIVGETGVGKEVFASAVHEVSGRPGKLVAINCAAIPRELVESELFGYEKGAHSTAQGRKTGLVELAQGGTLFLDEIGDMPVELQSKLLRFLQDRKFMPLGSTRTVEADVRIVAATSHVALAKGTYVQDALLARLGAQPIVVPPLRDRMEDLGRLTAHFLGDISDGRTFEPEAFQALMLHSWPLNVRELLKVITEAEVLSRSVPGIGFEHLPPAVLAALEGDVDDGDESADEGTPEPGTDGGGGGQVRGSLRGVATSRIRRPAPKPEELTRLLQQYDGSVARVARHLNRQYAVVWRCLQRYGIDANVYRPSGAPKEAEPAPEDGDGGEEPTS
jgi:transcriptional regulator with PAS, ATPase and Fis domain